MIIRPLTHTDITAAQVFTDRVIGSGYFSACELEDIVQRSCKNGQSCSLVLEDEAGRLRGLRITFPPGNWQHGKGGAESAAHGLTLKLWKAELQKTAYFQSLFVDPELTGQGWGKRLSLKSMEALKSLGAQAVVCHSWVESPHDSSRRYLRSLGFEKVATHPLYWK